MMRDDYNFVLFMFASQLYFYVLGRSSLLSYQYFNIWKQGYFCDKAIRVSYVNQNQGLAILISDLLYMIIPFHLHLGSWWFVKAICYNCIKLCSFLYKVGVDVVLSLFNLEQIFIYVKPNKPYVLRKQNLHNSFSTSSKETAQKNHAWYH